MAKKNITTRIGGNQHNSKRVLDELMHEELTYADEELNNLRQKLDGLYSEIRRLFRLRQASTWLRQVSGEDNGKLQFKFLEFKEWYWKYVINTIDMAIAFVRKLADILSVQVLEELRKKLSRIDRSGKEDNEWAIEHEAIVLLFLKRERLIGAGDSVPKVLEVSTGKQKISKVYHFRVKERHWVAKFDPREYTEWSEVERLRKENVPEGIILPHESNHAGDCFMLSRVAEAPGADECQSLEKFLKCNIGTNHGDCITALRKLSYLLGRFYQGKEWRHESKESIGKQGIWRDFFKGLEIPLREKGPSSELTNCIGDLLNEQAIELLNMSSFDGRLDCARSLLERFRTRFRERVQVMAFSRTHGDLNVGNVLVCPGQNSFPLSVQLIDFANSKSDSAIASDLACLEVDIWQVLLEHAVECRWIPAATVLSTFVGARSYLDGRVIDLPSRLAENKHIAGIIKLVRAWRYLASSLLRHPNSGHGFALRDYYFCLLFNSLRIFLLRNATSATGSDKESLDRQNLVLIGSSVLSLDVLDNLHFYSPGSNTPRYRPWESFNFEF